MAELTFDYVVSLGDYALPLPIKEIDGVSCYVYLETEKCRHTEKQFVRMVVAVNNSANSYGNMAARNQEEFVEIIEKLKHYKVDMLKDGFVDSRKYTPAKDIYKGLESPTLRLYDDCCVCLEMTSRTINPCGHAICLRCLSHLKKTKCPMGREDMRRYEDTDDE